MPILAGSGHRPPAGIAKLKHERIGIGKKRSRSQSEAEALAPALPAAGARLGRGIAGFALTSGPLSNPVAPDAGSTR
jgi:hypothetical protein